MNPAKKNYFAKFTIFTVDIVIIQLAITRRNRLKNAIGLV